MAVPDFQSIMLPLLKYASDGQEHTMKETREALAIEMQLTAEDLSEMLDSGTMSRWYNRVAWAKSYFTKMGLFDSPRRGVYIISERGKKVLSDSPELINLKFLRKSFPEEFAAFVKPKNDVQTKSPTLAITPLEDTVSTPEETLDTAYIEIRQSLMSDVLERLYKNTPEFFEHTVVRVLVAMGYGGDLADAAAAVVGRSHDGGIDGIIKEDRLGLDNVYVQAKRWNPDQTVGAPEIQKFIGALHGKRARKGVFITTSRFSKEAQAYADGIDFHIVLINGETLARYMVDFNVGVSTERSYELKRIDEDFFDEDI